MKDLITLHAIQLSGCIGEHVEIYFVPNGQKGVFLHLTGRLRLDTRQPVCGAKESLMRARRYALGDTKAGMSFCVADVDSISGNNTVITLK